MRQIRDAIRTVIALIKAGPFGHSPKPVPRQFDDHSYKAVGEPPDNLYYLEDRNDVLASARADRERDIAHWGRV